MFHIVGITPEALDFDSAFGKKKPKEKIVVTRRDLENTYQQLSDMEGKVDFICLGCPHYSIHEIAEIAYMLEGKKIHKDVTFWVCTSPATAGFAQMAGYAQKIRNTGAVIMSGPNFCPVFGPGRPCPEYTFSHPSYTIGNFATEATKQAFYARPNLRAKKVFLGNREQCIEAALTGYWKGGMPWKLS
jgi:predicted aconitase